VRGRNAAGGSVNIVTNKPMIGEWDGMASVQFGNYAQRLSRAMVNVPLGDQLALRLATFSERHDPFYENVGPVHTLEAAESADTLAYRAGLKWVPTDQVTLVVQHDYMHEGGTGTVGTNFTPALQAGLLPEEVPDPRAMVFRGPQGKENTAHWGVNGDAIVDFGPVLIDYTGGYRRLRFRQTNGGNGGVDFPGAQPVQIDNWSTSYWDQLSESTMHELRLFAPDTASLRWTVGGFFFNEDQSTHLGQVNDQSNGYAGGEYTMPDMNGQSWAAFVDATYDILKSLRGTAGVRYTVERKSRTGVGNTYGVNGATENFRYGTEGFRYRGLDRTDFDIDPNTHIEDFTSGVARFGDRDTLDELLQQPGVTMWDSFNLQDGQYKDQFVDFRVGLDTDVSEDSLLYVMFSTGHKSGGFNDNMNVTDDQGNAIGSVARTYDPESLYATEIGSKNELLDKKLIANVSAFWYEYQDQQFQVIQATGPAVVAADGGVSQPLAAVRFNAASSRILGLEADLTARLPAYLNAGLAAQFLHARFTDGTVADTRGTYDPATMPNVDLEGYILPRAPELTLNYSLGQTIPTDIGYFDWIVSAQTKTKYYMTVYNGDGEDTEGNVDPNLSDVVPSYTRLDAGIGYTRPSGKLRIDAFVNNATDVAYMTSLINAPNLNLRFFNPPRQFGTRLTVNF
jgi:iron complex outermembrane receptor protein